MRSPTCSCLFLALCRLIPFTSSVAQVPRGVDVPVGARVKAEPRAGRTIEGTALWSSGDTLVLHAEKPDDMRGDTVRLAAASLKNLRIVESPLLWRYTTPTDITFYHYALVPRPKDIERSRADPFRYVLLVGSGSELAGVDPVTGATLWARADLANLSEVALDIVGRTGYGVIMRGEKMECIDLRTGETRWETGALSLLSAQGWLPLPGADTLILMLGRTTASPATLMAVELGTGTVRWRRDGIFAITPKVFSTGGVSYLLGHQPPIGDTDTTLVLYLSTEGPIRLDARTGALLWRADLLRDAAIPTRRDGYARIRHRRGVLFVPSQKRLLALNAADGRSAWDAPRVFRNKVVRMEWTRHGLLVRGEDWLDLLDPLTGTSVWRATLEVKATTGIALDGDTVYYGADKTLVAIEVTNGSARTLGKVKFEGGESAFGIGVLDEGIVLNSWHNIALVDRQGAERYHRAYPAPRLSIGEALRSRTAGTEITRPTTRWHGSHVYVFTAAPDEAGREGFSVVKFDPAAGREDGRIWFDQRAPDYWVEWESGTVHYRREAREIVALTFGDWTAVADAARNGHAALVERLLAIGANPKATDGDGWTALHLAARGGHSAVVRLLLGRGAEVNAKTDEGWSAWMLAAREGHAEVAQALQDAGGEASDAAAAVLRGWHMSTQGRIADALAAYAEGQALDSTPAFLPSAWQALCWNGSVWGQAAEVMAACEKAVERTPESDARYAAARFARGLARALTADFAGAAADLEPSLDPGSDEEDSGPLQDWIDALREGRNPFTPAVLESLRRR